MDIGEWGLTPLLVEVQRRRQLRQQVYQVVQKLADSGHSLGTEFWTKTLREHLAETLREEYAEIVREQLPSLTYFEEADRPFASIRFAESWDGEAPFRKAARMSPLELVACRAHLQDMFDAGIIEPDTSPFGSSVIMVPKVDAGGKQKGWRVVTDYRAINKLTVRDQYPLPVVDDIIDRLQGKRIISVLDVLSGYWSVPMLPEHRERAAMSTPAGHW